MRRMGTAIALIGAELAVVLVTGWGAMMLHYLGPGPAGVRRVLAWTFVLLGAAVVAALAPSGPSMLRGR